MCTYTHMKNELFFLFQTWCLLNILNALSHFLIPAMEALPPKDAGYKPYARSRHFWYSRGF